MASCPKIHMVYCHKTHIISYDKTHMAQAKHIERKINKLLKQIGRSGLKCTKQELTYIWPMWRNEASINVLLKKLMAIANI